MVTHSATFLSQMDLIIVLKNGEISESGTFSQLLNDDGEFAEFLRNYSTEEAIESASSTYFIAHLLMPPRWLFESNFCGNKEFPIPYSRWNKNIRNKRFGEIRNKK